MRSFAVVAAALALTGSAYAADIAVRPPPVVAPLPTWTGFYFGGNLGWARGHSNWCTDAATTLFHECLGQNPDNFIGGGQFGWRYQFNNLNNLGFFNNLVIGIEGTYDAMSLDQIASVPVGTRVLTTSAGFNNLYSVTGQLGFAWNQALLYGKGGWAGTEAEFNADIGTTTALSATKRLNGWTAGGGIEYMMSEFISVGVEYDYYRFDNIGNISGVVAGGGVITCAFCGNGNDNVQTITGRINFKLGALGLGGWFR
jgi:outer membrane immunogenic protein